MIVSPLDGGSPLPSGWSYTAAGAFRSKRSVTFDPTVAPEGDYELWSIPSHATGAPEILAASDIGSNKRHVAPGDVLISRINPRLNRTWVVGKKRDHVQIASVEWIVFPQSEALNSRFFAVLLSDARIRDFLAANASGVGGSLTRARPELFDRMQVPVPPLNEQRRIVDRIEALFDEIDRGVESLRAAKRAIGLYRQSLLKSAFEGHLTADWRAKNPDKLESPGALLARIDEAREEHYRASLKDWERRLAEWRAHGKSDRRPSKPRKTKPPSMLGAEESGRTNSLPDGWMMLTAESVGTIQLGRQRSPKNRSKDFPTKYVRAANITEQGLALDDLLDMEFLPHELDAYRLEQGDLLLAEASGSASQVGKAAIWADQVPNCCFQNTVIRHRPHCREFAPFLLWLYRNFYVNGTFSRVAGGVGINHLSASRFAQIPLPICSPAEQAEVVRTLDEHLERADSLDAEIDANLTRAEALRQSILKQAFSGKLVPQDPNDEPAQALLARIRARREGSYVTTPRACNLATTSTTSRS